MQLVIILFKLTWAKIVIVDDIGLSQTELQKLKDLKGSFIKDKIKKMDNVLEFPRDFVNQKSGADKLSDPGNTQPNRNKHERTLSYNQQDQFQVPEKSTSKYSAGNEQGMPNNAHNANFNPIFDANNDAYNSKETHTYNDMSDIPFTKESRDVKNKSMSNNLTENLDSEKNLVRQEKENIIDANRARTSLIDLKINESKQRQDEIERNLYELGNKRDTISQKLKQRKEEQEQINMDVITLKNRKNNLSNSKRKIELERDKIEASLRLITNEIAHLNKSLDDLKTKSMTVRDEKELYENRLKQHEEDLSDVSKRLNGEEMRQTEYLKEVGGLESIYLSLRSQLEDLKIKKSREDSMQDRLEMERDRIMRNSVTFA